MTEKKLLFPFAKASTAIKKIKIYLSKLPKPEKQIIQITEL